MNAITPFAFEDHLVRVFDVEGEPWFMGIDVCSALEIRNSRDALSRLDSDERNTVVVADGIPGNPERTIVSEPGVFRLVFTSRKPEAERFKRWLAHEVLPSIRRTGAYGGPSVEGVSDHPALRPGHPSFNEAVRLVSEARRISGPQAALAIWRKLGLPYDAALETATAEQGAGSIERCEEEALQRFLDERTEPTRGYETSGRVAHRAYCAFAAEAGLVEISETLFGKLIRKLGIPTHRRSRIHYAFRLKEVVG